MDQVQNKIENFNGVAVEKMDAAIETIKTNPELAKFRFRAQNRWLSGGHNQSVIRDFYGAGKEHTERGQKFVFHNDEPDVLFGEDRGANPVEFALHALAGCMTTTMVYHAAAQGIKIESIESSLEGDIDLQGMLRLNGKVRSGYQGIRVKFKVKSDASPEELEKLAKCSPVFDTIANPVQVTVQVEKQ